MIMINLIAAVFAGFASGVSVASGMHGWAVANILMAVANVVIVCSKL